MTSRLNLVPPHCVPICRPLATATDEAAYAAELDQLRSKIFGTHIGNNLRSGRKLLRKPLKGDKVASYYLEPLGKADPLFVDERVYRQQAKLDRLKRRGKGPPKKGQGKRAGKRKARA